MSPTIPTFTYAASMQSLFEKPALQMMDYYLGDIIRETGKLLLSPAAVRSTSS